MIAVVFIIAIAIGLVVAIVTIDSYSADAYFTNKILDVLMDDEITSTELIDNRYITFGREVNKDYDSDSDQPIEAFTYYYLDGDGNKTYLSDGYYYPADYYQEDSESTPIPVYLGFYYTALEHLQVVKNVLKVIVALIIVLLIAFVIYLWYRNWCKRQERKEELKKLNN
jgi:amino acid transporter